MSRIIVPPGYRQRERGFIINPYALGSAGGVDNTKSLLHFDGSNGSTTFTDEYGHTWARPAHASAVAAITTSQYKFGGGGLQSATSGTGNRGGIICSHASLFAFGNGDFTIDWWQRVTQYYGTDGATNPYFLWCGVQTSGSVYPALGVTFTDFNKLELYASSSGTGWIGAARLGITGAVISLNTWQHIAITRSSTNLRLFVGGTVAITYSIGTTSLYNAGGCNLGGIYDGTGYPNFSMVGQYEEFHCLNGTASWTANFTVPSSAYSPP